MIAIYEMTSRGPSTLKRSISSIEGLIFPIEILLNDTYFLSEKKDPDVCVFILSVVEYICADILKMAGNYAENHRRKTIDLSDIRATVFIFLFLFFSFPPLFFFPFIQNLNLASIGSLTSRTFWKCS